MKNLENASAKQNISGKTVQGLDEVGKEVLQTETLFVSNDLDQFRILLNRINSIR
jgi:hypothetical protein